MADQDPDGEVLSSLVRFMSNLDDLDKVTDEEIVDAIRQARDNKVTTEQRGAAELQRRGWSYRRIAKAVGVHPSRPHRWVQGERPDATTEDADDD